MRNPLFTSFIFSFSFLFGLIFADDHGVVFLYPPSGLTVNYKDTVNVSYTSNFSSPQLITFCNEAGSNSIVTELTSYPPAYNGSKTIFFEWPNAVLCWFDLRPDSSGGNGANSPSFTVLSNERATSTILGLPQATSSPSSTPSNTPSNAAATTTSATTPSAKSDSKDAGLKHKHNGAAIGIGVGVAAGVIILALAAAAFFFIHKRKSGANTQYEPARGSPGIDGAQWQSGAENGGDPAKYGGDQMYMKSMGQESVKPQELSSEVAHELPSETMRHELNTDDAVVAPPQPGHPGEHSTEQEKKRYSWQMTPTA